MRTIEAVMYKDENTVDFAVTPSQVSEFNAIINSMCAETGEDWSSCLRIVDVEIDEVGVITYNGSAYAPNSNIGNGFFSRVN